MPMDKTPWTALAREATTFLPDVATLFKDVLRDPRVPRRAKVKVGAALAYLVSPLDLIADVIPGVGMLDDVAVIAYAARELLDAAGPELLREHWHGSEHGLDVVLRLVATDLRPRTMLKGLVADLIGGGASRSKSRGRSRVIDGEVVDRRPARSGR